MAWPGISRPTAFRSKRPARQLKSSDAVTQLKRPCRRPDADRWLAGHNRRGGSTGAGRRTGPPPAGVACRGPCRNRATIRRVGRTACSNGGARPAIDPPAISPASSSENWPKRPSWICSKSRCSNSESRTSSFAGSLATCFPRLGIRRQPRPTSPASRAIAASHPSWRTWNLFAGRIITPIAKLPRIANNFPDSNVSGTRHPLAGRVPLAGGTRSVPDKVYLAPIPGWHVEQSHQLYVAKRQLAAGRLARKARF